MSAKEYADWETFDVMFPYALRPDFQAALVAVFARRGGKPLNPSELVRGQAPSEQRKKRRNAKKRNMVGELRRILGKPDG